jgi:hypothetical protein
MKRCYHTCGHPIRVWSDCRRGRPAFFDGATSWTERTIRTCPRCGRRLQRADLRTSPPDVAARVHGWQRAWPELRRQIEQMIAVGGDRDGAAAETELDAFERGLHRLVALTTHAAQPTDNGATPSRS